VIAGERLMLHDRMTDNPALDVRIRALQTKRDVMPKRYYTTITSPFDLGFHAAQQLMTYGCIVYRLSTHMQERRYGVMDNHQ